MSRHRLRAVAWMLAGYFLLQNPVQAQEPFIVGVVTHLMNGEAPPLPGLRAAAAAGINSVRDAPYWSSAEVAPGQWRTVAPWRTWLDGAVDLNMTPLAILCFSTWFYNNAKPSEPQVKPGYLEYVDYATRQLGDNVAIYEVWNEWDLNNDPTDPALSADYAALVRDTAPIVRRNNPRAKILAGAITSHGMRGGFAERLIDAGVLRWVDGLSLHPYVHCAKGDEATPEGWIKWMRTYSSRLTSKTGKEVPLYLTEMSWPSHQGACGNTPATQAAYLARAYFLARTLPAIKGMWWYDLIDDGVDKSNQEHHFGLLAFKTLAPKPAYGVMQAIAAVVRDFRYDPASSQQTGDVYTLYFDKGTERVLVAWTTGSARSTALTTRAPQSGSVRYVDTAAPDKGRQTGQNWSCKAGQCSTSMTLNGFPKIISLGADN